jgi:hypothetical protein
MIFLLKQPHMKYHIDKPILFHKIALFDRRYQKSNKIIVYEWCNDVIYYSHFANFERCFLFDSLQFHQSQPWVGENKIDWWWDGSSHSR